MDKDISNNSNVKLFMNILGFVTHSVFNIACFVISIALIYSYTMKAFEYGKKIANDEIAVKESKEITVKIPEDSSIWDVAKILNNNGLVSNEILFVAQATLNGTKDLIRPGTYSLNADMSVNKIMDILQTVQDTVESDDIKITIPEGLNLVQMASLFESKGLFNADYFLEICETGSFNFDFVDQIPERKYRLEGYLFPDTYFLTKNPTPEEVINKMLRRFEDIYDSSLLERTAELELTVDQVVIMASIIEREVILPNERPLVSAIIFNRLKTNTPLQMCSTVLYALNKSKERLLLDDLKVDSLYNTYENMGLPVGPISAPGKASINAALYPSDVNYLYFVLRNEETGEHFFTNDYDAFVNAKIEFNQQF